MNCTIVFISRRKTIEIEILCYFFFRDMSVFLKKSSDTHGNDSDSVLYNSLPILMCCLVNCCNPGSINSSILILLLCSVII